MPRCPLNGRFVSPTQPDNERFWTHVTKTDSCWLWVDGMTGAGYGAFYPAGKVQVGAHVWAWESENGPVPDGQVIDHLCDTRHCVRPDHLNPTGRGANVLRSPKSRAGANMRKTHCLRGHELGGPNLIEKPNARNPSLPPYRACRTCENAKKRERRKLARTS